MDLLLGIDAGTTSVKAGLFSPAGQCLALARQEYQLSTPRTSWAELDPEIYWQVCVATVQEVIQQANVNPERVIALSVSSQGETMIALDSKGKPIYPAIVWLDNRATKESESLAQKYSDVVYKVTGIPEIIPTWTACKILWLKQNHPEIFALVDKFLLVQDFLIYRLTGRYVTKGPVSYTTMYFHIVQGRWWQSILNEIGVDAKHLPELVQPGEVVGSLSNEAASQIGLPQTIKVVGGGMSTGEDAYNIVKWGAQATGSTSGVILAPDPLKRLAEMISGVRKAWDEIYNSGA